MKHTEEKDFVITKHYVRKTKVFPKVLTSFTQLDKAVENKEVFVLAEKIWTRKEKDVYTVFFLDKPILLVRDICGVSYKFLVKNCGLNILLKDYQFELELEDMNKLIDDKKMQESMILNSPLPF